MLQNDRRYLLQSESISQELMLNWYDCTEEAFHCVDSFTESARYSSDREQETSCFDDQRQVLSRYASSSGRPLDEVRPFEVEHVLGVNKKSCCPLVFEERGFATYLAGAFVVLFNWQSNLQVQHLTWKERNRTLSTLAISPNRMWIAAGELGVDPLILVWNMETETPTEWFELRGHHSSISAMQFSPNGRFLASLGDVQDSQLIIWDCQSGIPVLMQNLEVKANLTALSFSSDSQSLFTATGKSHFMMWNFNHRCSDSPVERSSGLSLSSKLVMPSSEKATDFVSVKTVISGKSSFIFALNQQGLLYKLRRQSGSFSVEKKIDLRVNCAYSMDISATSIAVSCANGTVKLIRLKNLTTEAVFYKPTSPDQKEPSTDITPDAKYCAFDQTGLTLGVVYSDNSMVFWDVENPEDIQPRRIIQSHSGPISDIVPVPSCSRDQDSVDRSFGSRTMRSPSIQDPQDIDNEFATCSDKGVVNLWNLRLRRSSSRQLVYCSPTSDYTGGSTSLNNLKIEVGLRSILLNPPPKAKSKGSVRKGNVISTSVGTKKASKRSPTTTSSAPPKRNQTVGKKPLPKKTPTRTPQTDKKPKPATKRAGTGLKSKPTKSKGLSKTAAPVRLSTDLSHSKVVKAPGSGWKDSVVTVQRNSGAELGTLEASGSHTEFAEDSQLTCLRVSPNGLQLVVGDDKGQLRILNLANGEIIGRKKLHSSPITTIEFSRPGKGGELLLAVGAENGSVIVMDVQRGFEILVEKIDHEAPVTGISFSPDGTTVVSCAKDKYIYFDSLEEPEYSSDDEEGAIPYLSRHCLFESEYKSMHFNSARQTYMVGCDDNLIRVYNTAGQFVHSLSIPEELGAPIKILQGPVQSMVITCHSSNQFCVFEYFTGKLLAIGRTHDRLTGAMVINKGRSLLTTSEDGIMVIWKLDDGLSEICRSLPSVASVDEAELGYANDLYRMIQEERRRAARAVGELYNYPAIKSHNLDRENAPSLASVSIGASYSPLLSRSSSIGDSGLPILSPMAEASIGGGTLTKKPADVMPSWVNDGEKLRCEIFRSDFESASPSVPRPPKLELCRESLREPDTISIPENASRNLLFLQTGYSDHEGIPMANFGLTNHSQVALSVEEDITATRRFRSPGASTRWEDFKNSRTSSMELSLEATEGLMGCYPEHYDMGNLRRGRRSDSMDVPSSRPRGPEPPSSNYGESSRQHYALYGDQRRSSFDSQFTIPLMESPAREANLTKSPSPFATSPIGPNIHKRLSRSPMFAEEKRENLRPDSIARVDKMLSEIHPTGSESDSVFSRTATPERHTFYWLSDVWGPESNEEECPSENREEMQLVDICPPVDQPPALVINAGGHLKDNPLYSSGSESSEYAFNATKRFPVTTSPFAANSIPFEDSFSCSDCDQGSTNLQNASSLKEKVRTSMDDFVSLVQSQLCKTLEKIQEDPSCAFGASKSKVEVTPRKQAVINETRQQLLSMFGQWTRNSSVGGSPY